MRGERFFIPLPDSPPPPSSAPAPAPPKDAPLLPGLSPSLVGDVLERRAPGAEPARAPAAPSPRGPGAGFPAHRRRRRRGGREKEEEGGERARISAENEALLAGMTAGEIEEARREMVERLGGEVVGRVLMRLRGGEGGGEEGGDEREKILEGRRGGKSVSFAESERVDEDGREDTKVEAATTTTTASTTDAPSTDGPAQTSLTTTSARVPPPPSRPPHAPKLDPSSPSFLADLHAAYFADQPPPPRPQQPSQPSSTPHAPASASTAAASLRFTLTGALLPAAQPHDEPAPNHNHNHVHADPSAPGHTLPALALLSRSRVPAQRCLAHRALDGLLSRLAAGAFGALPPPVPPGASTITTTTTTDLAPAILDLLRRNRVAQSLREEVRRAERGGHASAGAYAAGALAAWEGMEGGARERVWAEEEVAEAERGEIEAIVGGGGA